MWENISSRKLRKHPGPQIQSIQTGGAHDCRGRKTGEHLIWLDDQVIPNSTIYSEVLWIYPRPAKTGPEANKKIPTAVEAHTHPYDEVITFFGTDLQDPHNLFGEVELWLDGEQHIMNKTFMAFVPAGMKHCPLIVRQVDKPMIHFTIAPANRYSGSSVTSEAKKGTKGTDKYRYVQHPKVEGEESAATEAKTGMAEGSCSWI
jgi:hypothetical protein